MKIQYRNSSQILQFLLINLERNWVEEATENIAQVMLKSAVDILGAHYVASVITDHPDRGCFIRYLDSKSIEMVNKEHNKNVDENTEIIRKLISRENPYIK